MDNNNIQLLPIRGERDNLFSNCTTLTKESIKESSAWIEYKDYVIGTTNIFITITLTLLVQHFTKKDKKKDNEYHSKLFLYQNKILPLHEKYIGLIDELQFLSNVIYESTIQTSSDDQEKLLQESILKIESLFESFNSNNLKILSLYDKDIELIFMDSLEKFQDEITSLISDCINLKSLLDAQAHNSRFEIANNDFIEQVSENIKNAHPKIS